jgi:hypothetical protein
MTTELVSDIYQTFLRFDLIFIFFTTFETCRLFVLESLGQRLVFERTKFEALKYFLLFQVYYLPFTVFYNQCVLPTMFTTLPLMRDICVRENITILHGHSVSPSYLKI